MCEVPLRVYVQCDWVVSLASGDRHDPELAKKYQGILKHLKLRGVEDTATWCTDSTADAYQEVAHKKSHHAQRNCAEINDAHVVLTVLYREDPPRSHWGSISLIGYALGQGKKCYIIASDDNVIWKHHLAYHPSVVRVKSVKEFIELQMK
jgi:hypothetical protein